MKVHPFQSSGFRWVKSAPPYISSLILFPALLTMVGPVGTMGSLNVWNTVRRCKLTLD